MAEGPSGFTAFQTTPSAVWEQSVEAPESVLNIAHVIHDSQEEKNICAYEVIGLCYQEAWVLYTWGLGRGRWNRGSFSLFRYRKKKLLDMDSVDPIGIIFQHLVLSI